MSPRGILCQLEEQIRTILPASCFFDEQREVEEIREAEETQINVRFVMFGFRFWVRIGYIRCDYDYMTSALLFRSTSKAYSPYEI